MTHDYSAFGLRCRLPFAAPLLVPTETEGEPDVIVELGDVPAALERKSAIGPWWHAGDGRFLYEPAWGAGRFLVEGGRRVVIQPFAGADERMLAFQLVGTVLAMVVRQRGHIVMHGISAAKNGRAVTVVGHGGAGKTTTLRTLMVRGWDMLSDDYTVLSEADGALVLPGIPRMHLTVESAAKLGVDIAGLERHARSETKAIVPTRDRMSSKPCSLGALFHLEHHDGPAVELRWLTGAEKFATLRQSFYLASVTEAEEEQFKTLSRIAARLPVARIARPRDVWSADALVDTVVSALEMV